MAHQYIRTGKLQLTQLKFTVSFTGSSAQTKEIDFQASSLQAPGAPHKLRDKPIPSSHGHGCCVFITFPMPIIALNSLGNSHRKCQFFRFPMSLAIFGASCFTRQSSLHGRKQKRARVRAHCEASVRRRRVSYRHKASCLSPQGRVEATGD